MPPVPSNPPHDFLKQKSVFLWCLPDSTICNWKNHPVWTASNIATVNPAKIVPVAKSVNDEQLKIPSAAIHHSETPGTCCEVQCTACAHLGCQVCLLSVCGHCVIMADRFTDRFPHCIVSHNSSSSRACLVRRSNRSSSGKTPSLMPRTDGGKRSIPSGSCGLTQCPLHIFVKNSRSTMNTRRKHNRGYYSRSFARFPTSVVRPSTPRTRNMTEVPSGNRDSTWVNSMIL